MIKRSGLSLCLLLSISFITSWGVEAGSQKNQPKPNFTGTWRLDRSKSNDSRYSGQAQADLTLVISHNDPELKITRKATTPDGQDHTQELLYYTDGRGETNTILVNDEPITSKTKWSGNKLVTSYTVKLRPAQGHAGRDLSMNVSEEWKLSADGGTLTDTQANRFPEEGPTYDARSPRAGVPSSVFVPAGPRETKKVFNRVP